MAIDHEPLSSEKRGGMLALLVSLWPIAVYTVYCSLIAIYFREIASPIPTTQWGVLQFGLVTGCGCVLLTVASLCGRVILKSLALSVCIAATIFVVIQAIQVWFSASQGYPPTIQQWLPISYLYNFPLILLTGAVPLLLMRFLRKSYLSREPVFVRPSKIGLEQMIYLTASVACLVFFCRVPMHALRLNLKDVLLFLPGMSLMCAAAAVLIVVPSLPWVFKRRSTWLDWGLFSVTSFVGVCLLSSSFSLMLGSWSPGLGIDGWFSYVILSTAMMAAYLPGIVALHWCGFRWVSQRYDIGSDEQVTQLRSIDRRAGRWCTGLIVALAVLTQAPIGMIDRLTAAHRAELQTLEQEVYGNGGRAISNGEFVVSLTISNQSKEKWFKRLNEFAGLRSLSLKDVEVGDADIDFVLERFPYLNELDLSGTQITDQSLARLSNFGTLYQLSLSETNVSVKAIAELIANSKFLKVVSLEEMRLTGEDLAQIYHPRVISWNLAGNLLSDKDLQTLWDGDAQALDFSRNPIDGSVFQGIRTVPLNLTLDGVSIGDKEFAPVLSQPLDSITLGKTQLTTQSLDALLGLCSYVRLLEGSFTEGDLAKSSPLSVPRNLIVSGKQITGDFLANWAALPMVLGLSDTQCGDEQIRKIAATNRKPVGLLLSNCPVTDACLPWLESIAPKQLSIQGTQITAKGLLSANLFQSLIDVNVGQFTAEELQQLRARKFQVVERRNKE